MAYQFDGNAKIITLTPGTTSVSVRDLISRWADWLMVGDNMKYLPAFDQIGGNSINAVSGTSIPVYGYLINNWKIRPQESSHTLTVSDGVLLTLDGSDPFINTIGPHAIRINYQQPVQAITVATGGGSAPSAADVTAAVWGSDLSVYGASSAGAKLGAVPSVSQIADGVWETPMMTHTTHGTAGYLMNQVSANSGATALSVLSIDNSVTLMLKYEKNRTKIDTAAKTLIVYDNDGTTPIQIFNLKDANGQPSTVESYERIPTL